MEILKKTTMRDQVHGIIKKRILNQTYQLGEKINMLELAQELSVSNSPIREALFQLEKEGLVTFTPNAGPSVVKIDNELFNEVQDTAKILLIGGYEQCLEKNLIPILISVMEECIKQQRESIHPDFSDYDFAKLSIDFDVTLIKIFHNTTLESLYSTFFNILFLIVLFDHQNCDVNRSANIQEHERILKAIKDGDHQNVKKHINTHFSRVIDFTLKKNPAK